MFLRKNWLPITVFIVAIVAVGLYLLTTQQTPKDPTTIIKPVEVGKQPKPPPPGETFETGHWHGDEWHKGSHDAHTQVTTPEVQVTPSGTQIPNENLDTSTPPENLSESSAPTQESSERGQTFDEAHHAWREKHQELIDEYSQLDHEMRKVFPTTVEEWKKYNANPEMWRKYNELWAKQGKVYARLKEHRKKEPSPPTQ